MPERPRQGPIRRLLVVEDEAITGLLLAHVVEAVGWEAVGPVRSLYEAKSLALREALAGALLDVNLNGEAVFPVADILAGRHVPFIFVTAYSAQTFPPAHAHRPIVAKPFAPTALARLLRQEFGDT